ncbi:unnamed protein product [Protopolystoma xenopodis]|uniref:Uncharacterized protein n=1 Tax=Protopolystoma xenopodis TaxID=117903 RepID=A0A448X6B3_9PLAT|nr:unnamed protein product [Protopolystoma xenopodis]
MHSFKTDEELTLSRLCRQVLYKHPWQSVMVQIMRAVMHLPDPQCRRGNVQALRHAKNNSFNARPLDDQAWRFTDHFLASLLVLEDRTGALGSGVTLQLYQLPRTHSNLARG